MCFCIHATSLSISTNSSINATGTVSFAPMATLVNCSRLELVSTQEPTHPVFEDGWLLLFTTLFVPILSILYAAVTVGPGQRQLVCVAGLSLLDVLSDIIYITTEEFASPELIYLGVFFLTAPTIAFMLTFARTGLLEYLDELWNAVFSDDLTEYYIVVALFLILLKAIFFLIMSMLCGIASFILLFVMVNVKPLSSMAFCRVLELEFDSGGSSTSWFNGSIVLEITLESLPQLILTVTNGLTLTRADSPIFIATTTFSALTLVVDGVPFIRRLYKYDWDLEKTLESDVFGHAHEQVEEGDFEERYYSLLKKYNERSQCTVS